MMEGIMSLIVEVVKDAMLSVTLAMLVLGGLFLLPGFFIPVSEMPAGIRWMSYIVPTKYTFDGLLFIIFNDQDFDIQNSDSKYSGAVILDDSFELTDVKPW